MAALASKKILPLLALLLLFQCANFRAYYNTYFNAHKAFTKAEKLKEKRLKENPLDTIDISAEEEKQLERSIEKASKVLELHNKKPNKYLALSLFMIGEAYLKLAEYPKAIKKYDELEASYPGFENISIARFHRAKCQFYSASYPVAKRSLLQFIAETDNLAFRHEAMEMYARLEKDHNSSAEGLSAFENMLGESGLNPLLKAKIYFQCAELAFSLKKWDKARAHALSPEISLLPASLRFKAAFLAARSLHGKGEAEPALAEMRELLKQYEFTEFGSEVQLKLAEWYLSGRQKEDAFKLLEEVCERFPRSVFAAEAYYRMGEYTLESEFKEERAIEYFDSSGVCGDSAEFAILSKSRAASLRKLKELRTASADSSDTLGLYRDFYIAELFLFNLDNADSALFRLNKIVADTSADSSATLQAAYARAFIYDEFKNTPAEADSMYQYVITQYPNTEYAKQSERNMGKVPTTITDEDKAHKLFLEAERAYFDGFDLPKEVVPRYAEIVKQYPNTRAAAHAQFVIAMLFERKYEEGDNDALYLAKIAHDKIRSQYETSEYYPISNEKLLQAGLRPGDMITKDIPVDSAGAAMAPFQSKTAKTPGPDSTYRSRYGSEYNRGGSASFEEELNSKEVIESEEAGEDEYQ